MATLGSGAQFVMPLSRCPYIYEPDSRVNVEMFFRMCYAYSHRLWIWLGEVSPLAYKVGTFSERVDDGYRLITFILTVKMPMSVILHGWLWSNEE